jgi:hypothetical protein
MNRWVKSDEDTYTGLILFQNDECCRVPLHNLNVNMMGYEENEKRE